MMTFVSPLMAPAIVWLIIRMMKKIMKVHPTMYNAALCVLTWIIMFMMTFDWMLREIAKVLQ